VRVVHDSDAAIFDKLKMDLGVRYEQTASVFEGNAYAAKRLDGDHVEVKVDGADGMFLEFVASKIVPFDLAETSDMLWRCFTRDQMELKDGYYSVRATVIGFDRVAALGEVDLTLLWLTA
jgi:hypothetical protein